MNAPESIVVLMYHRIGLARNAWEARYGIAPERFGAHMTALSKAGMQAVPIDALADWMQNGASLRKGSFVLTFDDGFRSVREFALPLLERLRWPFTVFVVSDLIGKDDAWTRSSNPDGATYPLLNADEILELQRRGVAFHSHTCTHPSLPSLDDARLMHELVESRATLQRLLGSRVDYLAYPFGHVDDRVAASARSASYRAAFCTRPGFNRRDVDRFHIRRIDVYGTDTPAMLLRKVRLGTNDGRLGNLARYYAGRARSRLPLRAR
ncbi:MAG TPA: polysaccharide deacetylase family protein [Casimicrobiaceae bacterium]|nr:polysaccharide deacetylase family protein [Casimicrobiaceae bacterium]